MMYQILFTESYKKKAKNFFRAHPELLKQYEKVLRLLEKDPYHPSLRLHKLKGKLKNLHSISINMSYRITLDFIIQEGVLIPLDIGSHDVVY